MKSDGFKAPVSASIHEDNISMDFTKHNDDNGHSLSFVDLGRDDNETGEAVVTEDGKVLLGNY